MDRTRNSRSIRGLAWRCLLVLAACTAPAFGESGAYRVEILVFRHAQSEQAPQESDTLRRFPRAWPLFEERPVIYPEDPAPLGVTSDDMRNAWRRLEGSSMYEPLYLQAWEQSRIDYHPPVRIHDDQVLLERLQLPERWADIDLTAPDFLAPYFDRFYRLDGTAQLRRSRFLHLQFDLEFRQELLPPAEPEEVFPVELNGDPPSGLTPVAVVPDAPPQPLNAAESTETLPNWSPPLPLDVPQVDENPLPPGAMVYRLQESRQVRTGEMLYFDTPYLGVIARVTATAGE